jgi:hypothetical protein
MNSDERATAAPNADDPVEYLAPPKQVIAWARRFGVPQAGDRGSKPAFIDGAVEGTAVLETPVVAPAAHQRRYAADTGDR